MGHRYRRCARRGDRTPRAVRANQFGLAQERHNRLQPAGLQQQNSTRLLNSNNPDGRQLEGGSTTTGGINVGHYAPGAVGNVWFTVEIDPVQAYERCGTYRLRSVGIARPDGMNQHINTTDIAVEVDCP